MGSKMKWFYMAAGGITALTILFAGAFVLVASGAASALDVERRPLASDSSHVLVDTHGQGFGPGGRYGEGFLDGGYQEALADALGITVEELEAARQTAHEAAVEDALAKAFISQDRMASGLMPGTGFRGFGFASIEYLADALEISVGELEDAQMKAHLTLVNQALEAGQLTAAQAEFMKARYALAPYLRQAMSGTYKEAIEQAVADGAITESQAELLLDGTGMGFQGLGGRWAPGNRPMQRWR
jgi:hypothetical protein